LFAPTANHLAFIRPRDLRTFNFAQHSGHLSSIGEVISRRFLESPTKEASYSKALHVQIPAYPFQADLTRFSFFSNKCHNIKQVAPATIIFEPPATDDSGEMVDGFPQEIMV